MLSAVAARDALLAGDRRLHTVMPLPPSKLIDAPVM
jgi:hypothetical protein